LNKPARKHIVIDARVVVHNQSHGIARYTDELIRNLKNIASPFDFTLLVNRNSPFLNQTWPEHVKLRVLRTSWINFLGQIELLVHLNELKPDLFHSPSFIVPLLSRVPLVTTIHDLNHVVLSENYSIFHRLYYSVLLAKKIKRSKAVITVSSFSKNEIVNFFQIKSEHVKVIHNGISEKFQNPPVRGDAAFESVLKKYELPEEYILSIGNKKPHKNIVRLVEAWAKSSINLPLVLLSDFDHRLLEIAESNHKKHNLHFLRFVPNDALPSIYSGAKLFVYPSIYEGFGFPPLEAAACNVPVVVSNCSSLPEVMRDCAVYIDPSNTDEIAKTLESALISSKDQQERMRRGIELVKSYSWSKAASETHRVYEGILLKNEAFAKQSGAVSEGLCHD
jgi:glycosyltransferase involved in cell wall biosynthesis